MNTVKFITFMTWMHSRLLDLRNISMSSVPVLFFFNKVFLVFSEIVNGEMLLSSINFDYLKSE